ncbi:hypothetical protein GOBAR_DD36319 [Gossypium barbadense]|nr:hypothetical protein GOBAR_DD36319 [Gossypium barbadense]
MGAGVRGEGRVSAGRGKDYQPRRRRPRRLGVQKRGCKKYRHGLYFRRSKRHGAPSGGRVRVGFRGKENVGMGGPVRVTEPAQHFEIRGGEKGISCGSGGEGVRRSAAGDPEVFEYKRWESITKAAGDCEGE